MDLGWAWTYGASRDLWIPLLVGVAGVGVAVAAWLTSRQATRLADTAVRAEKDRHDEDRRDRYEDRLDAACVELVRLFPARQDAIEELLDERRRKPSAVATGKLTKLEGWRVGHAHVASLRLFARGDDAKVTAFLAGTLLAMDDAHVTSMGSFLGDVLEALRRWRTGEVDAIETANEMNRITAAARATRAVSPTASS